MTTRQVTGDIHFLDDSAAEGDIVRFRLERVGFAEDAIYMPSDVDTTVQANGTIVPVDLWASGEGGRNLLCILPNGYTWKFRLDPGATPITLQELHALNAPLEPEVSPTIQDLLTSQIVAERARYANLLNPDLGSGLIGYVLNAPGAVGRPLHAKLAERVSIADFEDAGDAVATVTAALTWQQDEPGRALIVDRTWDLTGWPGMTLTNPLILLGTNKTTAVLDGGLASGVISSSTFLTCQSDVWIEHLTLRGFGACLTLAPTASHDHIDLHDVDMSGSTRAVAPLFDGAGVPVFDPAIVTRKVSYEACDCVNLTGQAIVHMGAYTTARASRNLFKNVSQRAMQFGKDLAGLTAAEVLAQQDSWQRTELDHNIVNGMISYGDNGAGVVSNNNTLIACICYGKHAIISTNIIDNLVSTASGKENDAIYTKCRYGQIISNIVSGVSGGSSQFLINIKGRAVSGSPTGVQGYGMMATANLVDCGNTAGVGIRIQNEQVDLDGNKIYNPTLAAVFVSSGATDSDPDDPASAGYSDIRATNNHLYGNGVGTGFLCTAIGSRLFLAGNPIDNFPTAVQASILGLAMTLAQAAASGATSIVVTSAIGAVAGRTIKIIRDDAVQQSVVIDSIVGTTINLATPLGGAAGIGNPVYQIPTTPSTSVAIDRNPITRIGDIAIRVITTVPIGTLRICDNAIDGITGTSTGAGIRIDSIDTIASYTQTGNGLANIQPSGSGYGAYIPATVTLNNIAVPAVPITDARIDDNHAVNVKTADLRMDTLPTTLRGSFTGSVASAAGTVANGATTTRSATVTGAQVGMTCDVAIDGLTTTRVLTYGVITGAGTVVCCLRNDSGGNVTLDTSMTFRVTVRRE